MIHSTCELPSLKAQLVYPHSTSRMSPGLTLSLGHGVVGPPRAISVPELTMAPVQVPIFLAMSGQMLLMAHQMQAEQSLYPEAGGSAAV